MIIKIFFNFFIVIKILSKIPIVLMNLKIHQKDQAKYLKILIF